MHGVRPLPGPSYPGGGYPKVGVNLKSSSIKNAFAGACVTVRKAFSSRSGISPQSASSSDSHPFSLAGLPASSPVDGENKASTVAPAVDFRNNIQQQFFNHQIEKKCEGLRTYVEIGDDLLKKLNGKQAKEYSEKEKVIIARREFAINAISLNTRLALAASMLPFDLFSAPPESVPDEQLQQLQKLTTLETLIKKTNAQLEKLEYLEYLEYYIQMGENILKNKNLQKDNPNVEICSLRDRCIIKLGELASQALELYKKLHLEPSGKNRLLEKKLSSLEKIMDDIIYRLEKLEHLEHIRRLEKYIQIKENLLKYRSLLDLNNEEIIIANRGTLAIHALELLENLPATSSSSLSQEQLQMQKDFKVFEQHINEMNQKLDQYAHKDNEQLNKWLESSDAEIQDIYEKGEKFAKIYVPIPKTPLFNNTLSLITEEQKGEES